MAEQIISTLSGVANHLRGDLEQKKYVLLFAYNGTGKTRLSEQFKNIGKIDEEQRDTLYFNALTEDLFNWDNDLENDSRRVLKFNPYSRFFSGLEELEMENRIGPLLARYADFNFYIDYQAWEIHFYRETDAEGNRPLIKVSRGEENIFIWCFFLAVVRLVIDKQESYRWVKFVYIDDPISSLDDNNAVAVAHHLAQIFKTVDTEIKVVLSSHHTLFFNVVCNELGNAKRYLLGKNEDGTY